MELEAESPPVVIVDVVGVVVLGVPLEGAFLPLMLLSGGAGATFLLKLLRLDPPALWVFHHGVGDWCTHK